LGGFQAPLGAMEPALVEGGERFLLAGL